MYSGMTWPRYIELAAFLTSEALTVQRTMPAGNMTRLGKGCTVAKPLTASVAAAVCWFWPCTKLRDLEGLACVDDDFINSNWLGIPKRGLLLLLFSRSTRALHHLAPAAMGVTTGNVIVTCTGREALPLREGEPVQEELALARQDVGPGKFTDSEGFVVTEP